jgi:hypothetical protein
MSVLEKVLAVILFAGALGSAHAVEQGRGADPLPAWSIAAPDFVHDSGMPQDYAGYRLASATAVRAADTGVGLKRAPAASGRAAAPNRDTAGEALAAAPATPGSTGSTDWMLLLSGVVVAGYMARRRTRDVAG